MTRLISGVGTALLALCLVGKAATAQEWRYTVKPGDTLWSLSERYLISRAYWPRLQAINEVADPLRLKPGRQLRMPADWLKMAPATARVLALQGEALVVEPGGASRPLAAGMLLSPDSEIRTSEDASVTLGFADGAQLLIAASSVLRLDRLGNFEQLGIGRSQLQLKRGGVEAELPPERGKSGSRFQIRTQAATLAVRGTRYRVRLPEPELTLAEVLSGRVLAAAAGRQRTVPADFGLRIASGRPPGQPYPLLAPPAAELLPEEFDRVPLRLSLPLPAGATGFRLQVGADPEFNALLFDGRSRGGELGGGQGGELPDGDYPARLRLIDANGLEGRELEFQLRLNARPEPPLLRAPQADDIVRAAQPTFLWAVVEGAAGYRFQLADNADFNAPLIDLAEHPESKFDVPEALPAGGYFWRVAVLTGGEGRGPFSDPTPFTLRPAPANPDLEPPQIGAQGLAFRWRAGAPGQRFQFQLSRDYWFDELLVDELLAQPQITVPKPPSDKYYIRVRVIDSDGYRGEFGPRQEIVVPLADPWRALLIPAAWLLLLAL